MLPVRDPSNLGTIAGPTNDAEINKINMSHDDLWKYADPVMNAKPVIITPRNTMDVYPFVYRLPCGQLFCEARTG